MKKTGKGKRTKTWVSQGGKLQKKGVGTRKSPSVYPEGDQTGGKKNPGRRKGRSKTKLNKKKKEVGPPIQKIQAARTERKKDCVKKGIITQ